MESVRLILYDKRRDAKRPDVKSQIIRPRFNVAFISRPNLAPLRSFKMSSFISKRRGVYVLLQVTFGFALALACVTGSHVSCGNFLQKAALSNDSGLIVADDYKK